MWRSHVLIAKGLFEGEEKQRTVVQHQSSELVGNYPKPTLWWLSENQQKQAAHFHASCLLLPTWGHIHDTFCILPSTKIHPICVRYCLCFLLLDSIFSSPKDNHTPSNLFFLIKSSRPPLSRTLFSLLQRTITPPPICSFWSSHQDHLSPSLSQPKLEANNNCVTYC